MLDAEYSWAYMHFSILINGWGRDPNSPKVREVFREMIDVGCNPDMVTYGIVVDVLCKAGRVKMLLMHS